MCDSLPLSAAALHALWRVCCAPRLPCACQAAAFMRSQIADAYDKWTTGFYDYIQALQNKIPY